MRAFRVEDGVWGGDDAEYAAAGVLSEAREVTYTMTGFCQQERGSVVTSIFLNEAEHRLYLVGIGEWSAWDVGHMFASVESDGDA